MQGRRAIPVLVGVLLLSCTPTEPCACTPLPGAFVIYGQVPAAGTVGALGSLRADDLTAPACTSRAAVSRFSQDVFLVPTDGRYRAQLLTWAPGPRCIRVVFFETLPGVSDSLFGPVLMVTFRSGPPARDSVRLDIPAP